MKKRVTCMFLGLLCLLALSAPAFASGTGQDWKSAYTQAIKKDRSEYGNGIQLVDLDLDGTPELLIGGYPGSGLFSGLASAYTFRDGKLTALQTQESGLILSSNANAAYVLYRNQSSGAYRIEGAYTLRAGFGNYSNVVGDYSLQGTKLNCKAAFENGVNTENQESTYFYYIGSKSVTEAAYKTAFQARNQGWEQVPGYFCTELWSNDRISDKEIGQLLDSYLAGPVLAQKSTHKMTVNGKAVSVSAYNINGNNYFKLRDVAMLLKGTGAAFSLDWNGSEKKIILRTGAAYSPVGGELSALSSVPCFAAVTDASLYADGVLESPAAYNIAGNNYYKLRDIAAIAGFSLEWEETTETILLQA